MVQALAFAELILGGLFIVSALSHESLGELLTKGLSSQGRASIHGEGTSSHHGSPTSNPPGLGVGGSVIREAEKFIGTPYKWGGTNEHEGFDCSGLVQAVYKELGVNLPRTAEEQYRASTQVPEGQAEPGDLLFFSNGHEVSHVGLYVSSGVMLDAPHTGAKVGFEKAPTKAGEKWGSDTFLGVFRP